MPYPWRVSQYATALLALCLAAAPAPPPPTVLTAGTVVENIACKADPTQRYALYLPAAYTPDRPWPIVYAMDARGQGAEVARILEAGAERYGWIVASSYNTQSDLSIDPNIAAVRAMWVDTHARFALDDKRVYLAGHSGTVRSAVDLAMAAPGTVVGIFGSSAGFPFHRPPTKDVPFDFFGTLGDRDMNYYEMMDLEKKLAALALPYRFETFEGGHDWPPPELATRVLGWFELRAMQRGLRAKDAPLVEELWAKDLEQARKAEAAGRIADAVHTWSAMRTGFAGLHDTAEAGHKAAELSATAAFRRETAAREARLERDQEYLSNAPRILGRIMNSDSEATPPTAARIASELKLDDWKKRAASADAEESLAAKRVLNTLLAQTSFYLPQTLLAKKDYDNAILMLSVAAEIRPESSYIWKEIAATYARKGKAGRKRALEALDKAVGLGFNDRAAIEQEPAFEELRQDARFQEIVAKIPAGERKG